MLPLYILAYLQLQCQMRWTIAFLFLSRIFLPVTISRGYRMLVVFATSFLWTWKKMPRYEQLYCLEMLGTYSCEAVLLFTQNVLILKSDTIEKQDIINFCNQSTTVWLFSSLWFWGHLSCVKRECSISSISLMDFSYAQLCIIKEACPYIFLYSSKLVNFLVLFSIFFSVLRHVLLPQTLSFMSRWQLIYFRWFISDLRKVSKLILKIFFLYLKSLHWRHL